MCAILRVNPSILPLIMLSIPVLFLLYYKK